MEQSDEQQAKPPRPNIRDEHRAVIVPGFGEVVQVALGAALEHVYRLDKRPTARLERLAFVTARTFQIKNAEGFGAFFE